MHGAAEQAIEDCLRCEGAQFAPRVGCLERLSNPPGVTSACLNGDAAPLEDRGVCGPIGEESRRFGAVTDLQLTEVRHSFVYVAVICESRLPSIVSCREPYRHSGRQPVSAQSMGN